MCELVIKAPGASATSAQYAAAGSAIFNTLAGNKYSAKSSGDEWKKANERKKQIQNFGNKIQLVANKYLDGLIRLGVKSESDKPVSVDVKPIDEVMFKKLSVEYGISIASIIGVVILISNVGEGNKDVSVVLLMLLCQLI